MTAKRLVLHFIVRIFSLLLRLRYSTVNRLFKRLSQSPGIPVSSPSTSYWLTPPSPISNHGSDGSTPLPDYADVVVIGSGITGTSFVRALMKHHSANGGELLTVVMLEAREACSGATGRNGGHITPELYAHYQRLKDEFGAEAAKEIIRFRLKHLPELLAVAAEEGLLEDSQCREVETFDVFLDVGLYLHARRMLSEFQKELPLEGSRFRIHQGEETFKKLQLSSKTVGCVSTQGGAVHPYRLVTGILERLLKSYPKNFYLFTHSPCIDIKTVQGLYEVSTPRGAMKTRHVVHATNAWASHLLPGLRKRIIPVRAVMTAQMPRKGLGSSPGDKKPWTGTRSFTFLPDESRNAFDYLTQQTPEGEFMFGGGFMSNDKFTEDLANADDRTWNEETASYVENALSGYFEVKDGEKEEVKMTWSGIIGMSSDGMPWVGRVPERVSGRKMLRDGGEWIAAGYSGEGMVHAWLSGKTLAEMMVGGSTGDGLLPVLLPSALRIGEERWKRTGIEDLIVRLFFSY